MTDDITLKFFKNKEFKRNTSVPIYRQIVIFVEEEILKSTIKTGTRLPSINEASRGKKISRHTVEKAYRVLRQKGLIQSIAGRGYFVNLEDEKTPFKMVVLINRKSFHKSQIIDSISYLDSTNMDIKLEMHFVETEALKNKIDEVEDFADHVLAFGFDEQKFLLHENASADPDCKISTNDFGDYKDQKVSSISENLEKDFYLILQGISALSKYERLVMVPSSKIYQGNQKVVENSFVKFCNDHYFKFDVRYKITDSERIKKGEAFFVFDEVDLVHFIKKSQARKLRLGNDVGVICFKNSPLTELMAVSVISIDYKILEELIGSMIMRKIKGNIKNEYQFIDRGSV